MTETLIKKHSKLAIASMILVFAVWIYWLILFVSTVKTDALNKLMNFLFGGNAGGDSLALVFLAFLFVIVPFSVLLTGTIFGIVRIFAKNKKRIFAVIGLILNVLSVVGFIVFIRAYFFTA